MTPQAKSRREELFDEEFLRKLEVLQVVSRRLFGGTLQANRRTRKLGGGIEFADHRNYSRGDDFRYLDWHLYGRLDRLLLRLFEEQEDLHIYMLCDTSRSMSLGEPSKLDYASRVVAALCYVALANLDRVSVVPFSGELSASRTPSARGRSKIFAILDLLAGLAPEGTTDFATSLKKFVQTTKRRGVAVVVSDFYDPRGYEEGLNILRYNKFEPYVVQLFDQREISPPLSGEFSLVDCETGELHEMTISPKLLARYRQEHQRFCAELDAFCGARGIPCFRTHTGIPFDELVLDLLRGAQGQSQRNSEESEK